MNISNHPHRPHAVEIAGEDEATSADNLVVWLAVGLIVGCALGFIAGVVVTNLLWGLA